MASKKQKQSQKQAHTGSSVASQSMTPETDAKQTSQAPSSLAALEVVPSDKETQFKRCFSVASQIDEDVLGKWINSP
jgi:hypothetical protein